MSLAFDRKTFFNGIRGPIFHGNMDDGQVAGCEAILAEAERRQIASIPTVAYILATPWWETTQTMQPVREEGGPVYFKRMYDIDGARPAVARELGNDHPGDGVLFRGRGLAQITGRGLYARFSKIIGADLVANPDLALQLDVAVKILFEGMLGGLFTGKKVADYIHGPVCDFVNARRVVNGTDKAQIIAAAAKKFNAALVAASQVAPT